MSEKPTPLEITDAVDFYKQWPRLRLNAEKLLETRTLNDDDAQVLRWMIKVVDMVGPHDVARDAEGTKKPAGGRFS
jgi:hypothetical protein